MSLKLRYLKLITLSILSYIVLIIHNKPIQAQEFETNNYQITININADGSANFIANRSISNNDYIRVIDGYDYILPSGMPNNIVGKLDDQVVPHEVTGAFQNYSKIHFSFPNVIKQNETRNLNITSNVKDFIKKLGNMKYFYIVASGDERVDLVINIPTSIGLPPLISYKDYEQIQSGEFISLKMKQPDSLMFIWPGEYEVFTKSTQKITNETSFEISQLISLGNNADGQEIEFFNRIPGEFALKDNLDNLFSLVELKPGETQELIFENKIVKFDSVLSINSELEELGWPESNKIVTDINELVKDIDNEDEKLTAVYNHLLESTKLKESTDEVQFTTSKSHWEYLTTTSDYTSFDYCFVISAFAQQLGRKAQIEFGYEILASSDFGSKIPQFWCLVEIDDENIRLFDAMTDDIYGVDFSNLNTLITKVKYGVWQPSRQYLDALGLLTDDGFLQAIEAVKAPEGKATDTGLISIIKPKDTYHTSGFYHALELSISNDSNKIIPLKGFNFGGIAYNNNIELDDTFSYALLPNTVNKIDFTHVRNENFLFKGMVSIPIELVLDDEQIPNATTNITIYYTVDPIIIVAFIILVLGGLSIVLITIWYIYLKRSPYKAALYNRGMY